jgi:hypothetical protein
VPLIGCVERWRVGYSIAFEALPSASSISLPELATTQSTINIDNVGGAMPPPSNLALDIGALTSVGGIIQIRDVHNLQRFAAPELASIDGEFHIVTNNVLTELVAPAAKVTLTGSLHIVANASLPTCTANAFAMSFSGPAVVQRNKADACGG